MTKKINQIINIFKNKKITLSVAESCTGGMLAEKITSVSGASKVFNFGIVTYSNQSKIKYLRIPSKINIAITGIAGPKGGTKQKPVGLVYIGIKKNKKTKINKYFFKNKNRKYIRENSVKKSLELIEEFI